MPPLSYQQPGLEVRRPAAGVSDTQIRDLQRHLRALGYLRQSIDGAFGAGTEDAVKALQHDLINNDGAGSDSDAPVRVRDYNRGRVAAASGVVDEGLAGCIADMLDDPAFPKLPSTEDPEAVNRAIPDIFTALPQGTAPGPFLLAILQRESNLKHFHEPRPGDEDTFIVVGLDRNNVQRHVVTSRGYGVGQFTLFHHPPSAAEVRDFMTDVGRNLQKAAEELREKFDGFVNGPTSATRADDRLAEFGRGGLRRCKFAEDDPRFMKECGKCARDAGTQDIEENVTPWHSATTRTYGSTQYYNYDRLDFRGVPLRKNFECDWPYAVRRYNGSGPNSYSYQALVLKKLLE
jgi:peptidoglycan hydrolase-like protein with peptidoglycan-binding domain